MLPHITSDLSFKRNCLMLEMKTYVDIGCTIFTHPKPVNNSLKFGRYFGGHFVLGLVLKAAVGASVAVAFASALR